MFWHCEEAAVTYSALPRIHEEWHSIVDRYADSYEVFDNWGMFAYTNAAYKPWADFIAEIDIGIWEQKLDEETWTAWVSCKREIAEATLRHGGTVSAAHGMTREGDVDLLPLELGGGFEVMKKIKRALDPNNVMNPGKYLLDQAYEDVEP